MVEFFWWNYWGGTRRFEGEVSATQRSAEWGSKEIQEGGGTEGQDKILQNGVQVQPIDEINLQRQNQLQCTDFVLSNV